MTAAPDSLSSVQEEPEKKSSAAGRRRRRRGLFLAPVALVGLVGAGAVYVVADSSGDTPSAGSAGVAPTGTVKITKGRLSARTSVTGTLAYAGSYQAINQAGGVYTRLPKVGQIVKQGQVLYRVDDKAVVLLKGARIPFYRDLGQGDEGPDVRQLNTALVALGYSEGDPDSDYYSLTTYYAVMELQDKVGLEETGTLLKSQAVFMPSDKVRITRVEAKPGTAASAGVAVVTGGSTERQVTMQVDASLQGQIKKGDKVSITLPNLKSTDGVVTSVGKIAKKIGNASSPTVAVTVRPTDPKATGDLDQAPVGVNIVTENVDDALSVPVNALLALLGGGYGIEVVNPDGTRTLLPVELGLFDNASGTVEIKGQNLSEGQTVVVPAS